MKLSTRFWLGDKVCCGAGWRAFVFQRFAVLAAVVCLSALLGGCTTTSMGEEPVGVSSTSSLGPQASEVSQNKPDLSRLQRLWDERTAANSFDTDYPIGPGDVLTVSVPEVAELASRKVRVSGSGMIELPLIGIVRAGGLTEDGLARELDQKLEKFMYEPQVAVFVNKYRNREAAVIGAVRNPGLVQLNSPSETILDVISKAGGLTSTAADQLVLIPAEQGGNDMEGRVTSIALREQGSSRAASSNAQDPSTGSLSADGDAAQAPGQVTDPQVVARSRSNANSFATDALRMLPQNAHPITINLHSTSFSGSDKYLNLPARPGDVIVVPGGGDVMVVGWVHKPGYFTVGSGLTVMGAIGAAGGPMYAADTKDVTLIRSSKNGSKMSFGVNLEKIAQGQEPDIQVQANDVIDVPYSGWRIGPYIFYSILSRVGIMGPAIPY